MSKLTSNVKGAYDYKDLHGIRNCTIVIVVTVFYAIYMNTSYYGYTSQIKRPLEACFCLLHVM